MSQTQESDRRQPPQATKQPAQKSRSSGPGAGQRPGTPRSSRAAQDAGRGPTLPAGHAGMHPVLLRVPHDHEYDFLWPDVEEWHGSRISALPQVASFLEEQALRSLVGFYPVGDVPDHRLRFAVLVSRADGRWVMVRHRHRQTWEVPGGHREPGECIDRAAVRELIEETGATTFEISPVCDYSVTHKGSQSFGRLYRCGIQSLGGSPNSEIAEVRLFDRLPDALTYPDIQPKLVERVERAQR